MCSSDLMDMGTEPYLVAAALAGVVTQRLTRTVCPYCKQVYTSDSQAMYLLGLTTPVLLSKGKGCVHCHDTGYKGRQAVHEIVLVDSKLRELISQQSSLETLRAHVLEQGTLLMKENLKELVLAGITTIDEYLRLTYSID